MQELLWESEANCCLQHLMEMEGAGLTSNIPWKDNGGDVD